MNTIREIVTRILMLVIFFALLWMIMQFALPSYAATGAVGHSNATNDVIGSWTFATNGVIRIRTISTNIVWQYDDVRARLAQYEKEVAFAKEFSRTNTDRSRGAIVGWLGFDWRPKKGDRELGYREDGSVVWRFIPEGK